MAAETTPGILATAPFGAGSVGLGLHPLTHLPARDQVATILAQARAAETAGFDGVTVSEHHAGFPSYLPQPLLAANWILADTTRLWSGPGPLLLSLRNPALVAEEIAWTAARFPGRVGIAVAPGYVATDFEAMGETKEQVKQFHPKIDRLVQALSADGPLAADPAVSRWAATPGPMMVAANSKASIEHTAAIGAGVVFPGGQDPDRHGRLAALYRDLGGKGTVCGIRSMWVGEPPETPEVIQERAAYAKAGTRITAPRMLTGSVAELTESVSDWAVRSGIDAINIRLHVPGVAPELIAEQIAIAGEEILPHLRAGLR
jgi:alkanesulfonate monooxygenase SsuD/methylene tetrahydromethanopterin reductase-like flavin-dependent oxidoreductase (luciferase family)